MSTLQGNRMLYVSKRNEPVWRLALAIAGKTNRGTTEAVTHGLRMWIRYMETYYPEAVAEAKKETGVTL